MPDEFFRTSDRSEPPPKRKYGNLGLEDNPFPQAPGLRPESSDPRVNGTIYEPSLRALEHQQLARIFIPHEERPHPKRLVFLMDFATRFGRGIGKSSFLHYHQKEIQMDWGKRATGDAKIVFASHIQPQAQTRKFWELSRLIAKTLNDQGIIAKAIWRLRYLKGDLPQNVIDKIDDPETTVADDHWLDDQAAFLSSSVRHSVEKTLRDAGIPDDFARVLSFHGHRSEQLSEVFFDRKTDHFWRKEANRLVFNDLVKLFWESGIDLGLLMIDEVEKITTYQNKSERREFVDELRYYIFDGDCACAQRAFYRILLTIHPYIQELLLPHWESAGLDRFAALSRQLADRYTIYFRPINIEMAENLIEAYLRQYRTSDGAGAGTSPLHPLDSDAVAEATKFAKGIPGRLLAFLHELIEYAAEHGWKQITVDEVRLFARSREPPEPRIEESEPTELPPPEADLLGDGLPQSKD